MHVVNNPLNYFECGVFFGLAMKIPMYVYCKQPMDFHPQSFSIRKGRCLEGENHTSALLAYWDLTQV